MTTFAIEVQHSSDFNLDGKWFELERTTNPGHAVKLWEYFAVKKPIPKGIRPANSIITGSYAGRPVRIRIVK